MGLPDRQPDLRLEILSQPRLLSSVRAMIGCFAGRMGFDEGECGQISLAVDEALSNVIHHGYDRRDDGLIWISVWFAEVETPPTLFITIEDEARQVDPAEIKPRNLDEIRPGGLGVHIIRHVMDHVEYTCRCDCGMRLVMHKRLESSGATSPPGPESGEQPPNPSSQSPNPLPEAGL